MRPGPIKEKVIAEGAEIYCERRGIGPLFAADHRCHGRWVVFIPMPLKLTQFK